MKQILTKVICILLALGMMLPYIPVTAVADHIRNAEHEAEAFNSEYLMSQTDYNPNTVDFAGKTISVLGDSISTFSGVSNDATANPTLSGGWVFYNPGTLNVYREDTWWQQTADTLGMELLVNNSWSGSAIFSDRAGTVGAYLDRCVQLHNAEGQEPDIIAFYLGTNDFSEFMSGNWQLGTVEEIDYSTLIIQTEDGYTYTTPTTICEAYAIMLHKTSVRYPNAEIYCLTPLPRKGQSAEMVSKEQQFNASIRQMAAVCGAFVADLYHDSGIQVDSFFGDFLPDGIHPSPMGMDAVTGCLISSILANSRHYSGELSTVTYELENTAVAQGTVKAVEKGGAFYCSFLMPQHYSLNVTVTMDGQDITESCCQNGEITIERVTGDIAITASASLQHDALNYRWEVVDGQLVSVAENGNTPNTPTMLSGSFADGVLSGGNYQLENAVVLQHHCPWALEWRCTGNWSGMLLASSGTSNAEGTHYLFRTSSPSTLLAMGEYRGGQYHNYGVTLPDLDMSVPHTYRLENRIAEDGSNMVFLLVDGVECGAMNNYYIGGESNQNQTVDWANGRDFIFSHLATANHKLNNLGLEHIQVIECNHNYMDAVTDPTCTEQGYTTHTCTACGDSYEDSYVEAAGHDYRAEVTLPTGIEKGHTDYICARCDHSYEVPWLDASAYKGKTIACIGDSITAGVGVTADQNDYVTLLAEILGMEYIRLGVSGTTLATGGHRTCNISKLTADNISEADVITILMGINDFDQARAGYYALGDINSTDTSTIYGAVKMWCQRIEELRELEGFSDKQFWFVTPVITSWNDSCSSVRDWDQSKTNIHGYTLRDMCNAIIEVCALYDVPVIDLNLISGMYYVSAEDNNVAEIGGDGVHPGAQGHKMMAEALSKALLQSDLRNDHDHDYGSWITTRWPSCLPGEEQRVCSICTAVESRIVEANGVHKYVSTTTTPTCTEQGCTTHTCTTCGDSYTEEIPALGHSFVDGACEHCGELEVQIVPGDINGDGWVDVEDAMLILQYEAMLIDETDLDLVAADVNGDGWVDVEDAMLILQFDALLIDKFPIEDEH